MKLYGWICRRFNPNGELDLIITGHDWVDSVSEIKRIAFKAAIFRTKMDKDSELKALFRQCWSNWALILCRPWEWVAVVYGNWKYYMSAPNEYEAYVYISSERDISFRLPMVDRIKAAMCRRSGHKCGVIWYNWGYEPDMTCVGCGDYVG